MNIKSIVLAVLCMLLLVGCTDDSSSEKSKATESATIPTTTAHEDISFEATVLKAYDGYITLVDAELTDGNGDKIGEAKPEYDKSVKVPSDIKVGDKIKITVGANYGIVETGPPIITDVKKIEKIS